jgi:hypothetical protein
MINRDTVASVGLIMSRSLPFVEVNTTIRVFRQALALDEVRDRRHMIAPPSLAYSLLSGIVRLTLTFSSAAPCQVPSERVSPYPLEKITDSP